MGGLSRMPCGAAERQTRGERGKEREKILARRGVVLVAPRFHERKKRTRRVKVCANSYLYLLFELMCICNRPHPTQRAGTTGNCAAAE